MGNNQEPLSCDHEIFKIAKEINQIADHFLEQFNAREMRIFDLPAHQRIFLFILTRIKKTYSSILILCEGGFGQDVSMLLRSLLEHFVALKYILHEKDKANDLAVRFVDYKWVIFRRQLPAQEKNLANASQEEKDQFAQKKKMVIERTEEFKKKYRIISDRALMTWSGKTVRDMARQVDRELLSEYETTFQLCSRFSHPSILGDNEYLVYDDKYLIFSPLPSVIGVYENLSNGIKIMLDFLYLVNDVFDFQQESQLKEFERRYCLCMKDLSCLNKDVSAPAPQRSKSAIHQSIIKFKIKN